LGDGNALACTGPHPHSHFAPFLSRSKWGRYRSSILTESIIAKWPYQDVRSASLAGAGAVCKAETLPLNGEIPSPDILNPRYRISLRPTLHFLRFNANPRSLKCFNAASPVAKSYDSDDSNIKISSKKLTTPSRFHNSRFKILEKIAGAEEIPSGKRFTL